MFLYICLRGSRFDRRSFQCRLLNKATWGSMPCSIPHWLLPAVRDLTRDGRWSTYDESVLNLSTVSKLSFRGKCARTGHPLKLPSPTKLARLWVTFLQLARRGALPARGSICMSFLCGAQWSSLLEPPPPPPRPDSLGVGQGGGAFPYGGTRGRRAVDQDMGGWDLIQAS